MRVDFGKYHEAQRTPMKEAVIDLVRIPSVLSEDASQFTFGEAIDQALRKILQIAGGLKPLRSWW